MSLLGAGMCSVRIWTPDKSGSRAPKLLSKPSRCARQLEDAQGLLDLVWVQAVLREEGQGQWVVQGCVAQHPTVQGCC